MAALLGLMKAPERLEYKAAKTLAYWPGAPAATRRRRLFEMWARIVAALDGEIAGVAVAIALPADSTVGQALKA
jgi:hypothetical protein